MKPLIYFAILFFVLTLSRFVFAESYVVDNVVTGDRFRLTNEKDVRLLGVDVPESRKNDRAEAQAQKAEIKTEDINGMGLVALVYVKSLILGKEVLLEFDKTKEDQYGLMVYVFVKAPENIQLSDYSPGVIVIKEDKQKYYFLNALLVDLQYAKPKSMPPNVKYDELFYRIDKASSREDMF